MARIEINNPSILANSAQILDKSISDGHYLLFQLSLLLFGFEFGYFLHLLHLKSTAIHPSRKSRKQNEARLPLSHGKLPESWKASAGMYVISSFFISINDRRPQSIDDQSTIHRLTYVLPIDLDQKVDA